MDATVGVVPGGGRCSETCGFASGSGIAKRQCDAGGIAVGAGGIAYKAAVHLSGQAEESLKAAREAAQKAAEERKQNPEPKKKDGEKSSFATWFDSAGRRHYEGPFESPMTRREAALILGVRETATAKRIKDAHRRMTRINHPDLGGSAFLTAKVNEAKEMLMKGKGDE